MRRKLSMWGVILGSGLVLAVALGVVTAPRWRSQSSSEILQIVSPVDGTVVTPGQDLQVVVSARRGSSFDAVAIIGEELGITEPGPGSPYTFTIRIPTHLASGPRQITAVGARAAGEAVFSSPVTVDIERNGSLSALDVNIGYLSFAFAGEQFPLRVTGTFGDGSTVNLTASTRTSYSVDDPAVATVDRGGMVTAVGSGFTGTTRIHVHYGNMSAGLKVVVPRTMAGDLNGDGNVSQDDVNEILTFLDWPATGPFDARDLNHDGTIDIQDARACAALCTNPPCAVPDQIPGPPVPRHPPDAPPGR